MRAIFALLFALSILLPHGAFAATDSTPPSVGSVSPTRVSEDKSTTFSFPISDNVGVTSCTFFVDGDSKGLMQVYGNVASKEYVFPTPGVYEVYATCFDGAGNSKVGVRQDVTITEAGAVSPGQDVLLPTVGIVTPQTAVVGTPVRFTAGYADNTRVAGCNLYVGGVKQGEMQLADGAAWREHTFLTPGTYDVYVSCVDAAGNVGMNALPAKVRVTTVTGNGLLIKLQCPSTVRVNDPCTTVYFYGSDGKRHAFTSEAAYFSWYENYNDVQIVDADFMAEIPLGANVTYRPVKRLVKFRSVKTVYVVTGPNVLRPIASEADARALYGASWNRQIDDVSDIFLGDYAIGDTVRSAAEIDRLGELDRAPSPNILFL